MLYVLSHHRLNISSAKFASYRTVDTSDYKRSRPIGKTARSPPAICLAAAPWEDVAVAEELVPVADVLEALDEVLLSREVCVLIVAVTPLAFVQALGTDGEPETKLTAAHCEKG